MHLFRKQTRGKNRAVIIGLDGMPHTLALRLMAEGYMPHLKALVDAGSFLKMDSVLPTVSSTAWASIVTGCAPGRHRIFGFVDRVPNTAEMFIPTSRQLASRTWVEHFSGLGKRVFSMGVPTTFPPKAVNGILISGFLAPDLKRATYPPHIAGVLEAMGYLIDIDAWQARENREAFLDEIFTALEKRCEAMFKYFAQERWDLFVTHFMDTDRLHHFLWGEVERGQARFVEWFHRFYGRVDQMIGELVSRLDGDVALMIMSDHGFCSLYREVHLNYWLRQMGLLEFGSEIPRQLRDLSPKSRCYSLLPGRFYLRVRGRDHQGCVQPGSEYEQIRRDIAAGLMAIRDPETGGRVIDQVFMREELYGGDTMDSAPDLIARPSIGYDLKGGFERQVLLEPSPVSGTHTFDNAMWFLNQPGVSCDDATVVDVLPTLYGMLGLDLPGEVDGRCLI
jgi:predicted AlkP superfamily phosphohydrolase/phosphomutase